MLDCDEARSLCEGEEGIERSGYAGDDEGDGAETVSWGTSSKLFSSLIKDSQSSLSASSLCADVCVFLSAVLSITGSSGLDDDSVSASASESVCCSLMLEVDLTLF